MCGELISGFRHLQENNMQNATKKLFENRENIKKIKEISIG